MALAVNKKPALENTGFCRANQYLATKSAKPLMKSCSIFCTGSSTNSPCSLNTPLNTLATTAFCENTGIFTNAPDAITRNWSATRVPPAMPAPTATMPKGLPGYLLCPMGREAMSMAFLSMAESAPLCSGDTHNTPSAAATASRSWV